MPASVIVACGLVVLAWRADRAAPAAEGWATAFDLVVGVVVMSSGWLCAGLAAQRTLLWIVGALWLVGSFSASLREVHQAALLVALVCFGSGRVMSVWRWVAIGAAVAVVTDVFSTPVAAVLFVAGGVGAAWWSVTGDLVARVSAVVIGAVVAVVLGIGWWNDRIEPGRFDPDAVLLVYEIVVVTVAVWIALRSWVVHHASSQVAEALLADDRLNGLRGLEGVLRHVLRDPTAQIINLGLRSSGAPNDAARLLVGGPEDRRQQVGHRTSTVHAVVVRDEGVPVAVVESKSPALNGAATAVGVASAVRATIVQLRLQAALQDQLAQLEDGRVRIVAAIEEQRRATAVPIRGEVVDPLRDALVEVDALRSSLVANDPAIEALSVVAREVESAISEALAIVAGVPPTPLGNGLLRLELTAMAQACPIPVRVEADRDARADADREEALYFACSEGLANALKHAAAATIEITLRRSSVGVLELSVSDDGCGGADPSGAGLVGLSDRLAAHGGSVVVHSLVGVGTRLVASVPVRRSCATA